eukprot:14290800-Ditylum_brightwellii.AAC.1
MYLGLPSPYCAPFVGQWIGTEGHKCKVDKHGNVVSAHNAVPCAGHSIAHNSIQAQVGDILKISGMHIQAKAENLFHGRLQEPFIGRYCENSIHTTAHDRVAYKDSIIPDLLIHNYPVRKERRLDGNGISQSTAQVIVEIKGIYVGKNQQTQYPAGNEHGTDKLACQIKAEYIAKSKKCDDKLAQENINPTGPLQDALSTFLYGGLIPLVYGAFGEVN